MPHLPYTFNDHTTNTPSSHHEDKTMVSYSVIVGNGIVRMGSGEIRSEHSLVFEDLTMQKRRTERPYVSGADSAQAVVVDHGAVVK